MGWPRVDFSDRYGDAAGLPAEAPTAKPPEPVKKRKCLRCRSVFPSEWAGERICKRCKGSVAWRMGTPIGSSGSF